MYQNIFIDKKNNICYLWDDLKGMISFPFKKYAYRKKPGGNYKSMFGDELEKIFEFDYKDSNVFEGDVPPETLVLRDMYESSDESSKNHKIIIVDIEVDSEGGFPNVETAEKEITAISLFDKISDKYYTLILDKESRIKNEDIGNISIKSYIDEASLLESFLNKWEEIQPTIVTGWNSSSQLNPNGGFDIPYLFNRLKVVLGENSVKRLSSIGVCYYNKFKKSVIIAGISCLDYMDLYKKFIGKNRPSFALGQIGKLEVNMDKIEYKGSLNSLYKNDIQKYVEYNLNDVQIVVTLDKKFKYIELCREICHIGHIPYEWFYMSSRYLEGAILTDLKRNKLVAPNKPSEGSEELEKMEIEGEEGFEGAYVKHPIPGRYDWIYDLDLSSMYPNIIISLNISPETKIGKVMSIVLTESGLVYRKEKLKTQFSELDNIVKKETSIEEYINLKLKEFDSDCFSQNYIVSVNLGGIDYTFEKFKSILEEENLSLSSNGVIYIQSQQGVIPKLLSDWFQQRKEMRKLSKKYHAEGNKELEEYYDRKQYNYKILLNSCYGGLGLPVFRFFDRDNAAAVTSTGVTIIQTTAKLVNQYYNSRIGTYKVTYEDGTIELLTEDEYNQCPNKS